MQTLTPGWLKLAHIKGYQTLGCLLGWNYWFCKPKHISSLLLSLPLLSSAVVFSPLIWELPVASLLAGTQPCPFIGYHPWWFLYKSRAELLRQGLNGSQNLTNLPSGLLQKNLVTDPSSVALLVMMKSHTNMKLKKFHKKLKLPTFSHFYLHIAGVIGRTHVTVIMKEDFSCLHFDLSLYFLID